MDRYFLTTDIEKYAPQLFPYREELLAEELCGCGSLRRAASPEEYIAQVRRFAHEESVPEGYVPATQLLCIREDDGRLCGMLQLRHRLTADLERFSGHIGYSVRPSERRKGIASFMLREALLHCRALGIRRALVTCREENEASRRTILSCGGVYENTECTPDGARMQRYRFTVSGSILESTDNTRPLVCGSYRYVRSDRIIAPTARDLAFLRERGLRTVVDLRSEEEVRKDPCPLAQLPDFEYHSLPIRGGGVLPNDPALVSQSYLAMCDKRMEEVLRVLRGAKENAIYFCTAGKDRTGVVSALLLRELGASEDEIVENYLITRENIQARVEEFLRLHPEAVRESVTASTAHIRSFLRLLDA